ncbi:MAG: hypothetical protein WCC60_04305 [Ilumatobacteraceae bacterium]
MRKRGSVLAVGVLMAMLPACSSSDGGSSQTTLDTTPATTTTVFQARHLTPVWSAETAQLIAVAFSPDGKYVATSGVGLSGNKPGALWDAETGAALWTLDFAPVASRPSFNRDSSLVMFLGVGGDAMVFDRSTGAAFEVPSLDGANTNTAMFSPDGTDVVAGTTDGRVVLWDARTGEVRTTLTSSRDTVDWIGISPDGATIVGGALQGDAVIWDVATGKVRATLTPEGGSLNQVAMSPDGAVIATAAATGKVQLWETAGGTLLGSLGDASVNAGALTFSPDGSRLAIDTFEARSTLWDVPSRSLVADLGSAGYGTFSPDGTLMATTRTGIETTFGLWDAVTGETLGTYDGSWVAFDPRGERIGVLTTTELTVFTIGS